MYAKFTKCEFWLRKVLFLRHLIRRLPTVLVLTFLVTSGEYVVYSDVSYSGLGCILMQNDRVVPYASPLLKVYDVNYPIHDLELAVVVFALKL